MENTLKQQQSKNDETNSGENEMAELMSDYAQDKKKETWETNHLLITEAIAFCMRCDQRMPSKTEIAEKTGLSRVTVHEHLKEYALHPKLEEESEQFRIIAANVLAGVVKYAMNGDPRAARLYFEMVEKMNSTV
jgi:hypothetical protein